MHPTCPARAAPFRGVWPAQARWPRRRLLTKAAVAAAAAQKRIRSIAGGVYSLQDGRSGSEEAKADQKGGLCDGNP